MNTVVISLIIPIYNAKRFLTNILEKLEKQNNNEFEVIMIDDGSKDSSYEICCDFAQKNLNFIVFHQENSGASAARNQGILLAKGKYIAFIDSDDDISDDYVSTLCNLCNSTEADIIQLDAYIGTPSEGYYLNDTQLIDGVIEFREYCYFILAQKSNPPWDKIYKSDVIIQNSIHFDVSMIMGEDICFTLDVLKHSHTIWVTHKAIYYYLQNPNGLCVNVTISYFDDLDKLFYNMKEFVTVKKLDAETEYAMNQSMFRSVFRAIGLCISNGCSKKEIKQKLSILKSVAELGQISYVGFQEKIRNILMQKHCYYVISKSVGVKKHYTILGLKHLNNFKNIEI